jgi:hypothetical protein
MPVKPTIPRTCLMCNDEFFATGRDVAKGWGKYCSNACRFEAKKNRVDRLCQHCGKPFTVRSSAVIHYGAKYCSSSCQYAGMKQRVARRCRACGNMFELQKHRVDTKGEGLFCSRTCASESFKRQIIQICEICGEEFSAKRSSVRQGEAKTCSRSCDLIRRRFQAQNVVKRSTRRPISQQLRRLVWERDQGMCDVCRRSLPFNRTYHCGHVVDHCLGGTCTLENLVVMCRACNLTKPYHTSREDYEAWRTIRRSHAIEAQ